MQQMYWLFREHHIRPIDFYNMGDGERRILKVFMIREIEEIEEARSSMEQ